MIYKWFSKENGCPKYKRENNCCDNYKHCLNDRLSLTRKYLSEYEEITEIFKTDNANFKDVVEVVDNVLNQFIWLPEADWIIIQQQIDLINVRIDNIPELRGQKFSCTHITKTLKDRSEIY